MSQVQPPYTSGTATVAANGTTVTVTGILDDTNCIEGDHFRDPATGYETRILGRVDATHFTIPPYKGTALAGASYEIYPDSTLRVSAGRNTATVNTLITRLKDKGIAWVLPAGFTDPAAAGWGADEGQQVYQPTTGKWWSMQSGTWTVIAAPSGMQAANALSEIAAISKQADARANIGAQVAGSYQAALGYTPVNKAGDTMSGNLVVPFFTLYNSATSPTLKVQGDFACINLIHPSVFSWGIGHANGNGQLIFYNGDVPTTQPMKLTQGGNLTITGTLSKGGGTFLIDHPLDPANRDLAHGFVEAPRYDLIYRGMVTLVAGKATVDIDVASNMTAGTFAALTTNAVVMNLQNQSGFSRLKPSPLTGGTFDITCEDAASTDTVAWLVIAERNDFFVKQLDDNCDSNGRFIPDRDKPDYEEPAT